MVSIGLLLALGKRKKIAHNWPMREEPIHVFGHVTPAGGELDVAAKAVLSSWGLLAELELCGELWQIQFEGVAFPHEELAEAIRCALLPDSEGRLDVIDREGWTLTRYIFARQGFRVHTVGLNQVLDYSGF